MAREVFDEVVKVVGDPIKLGDAVKWSMKEVQKKLERPGSRLEITLYATPVASPNRFASSLTFAV